MELSTGEARRHSDATVLPSPSRWPRLVRTSKSFLIAHAIAFLMMRGPYPVSAASWPTEANPQPLIQSIRSARRSRAWHCADDGRFGWSRTMAIHVMGRIAAPVPARQLPWC
jgi:hypothetical protein